MDIVARAKNIILSPNSEWPVIAAERTNVGELYTGYIMPMAAIPPVAALIGITFFLGGLGLAFGILGALVSWIFTLIGIYVTALVAQWLAPRFGGDREFIPALKLIAYSHTATWLGGIFLLIPFLGIVTFLMGLYGLYLLYSGAPPVMNVPKERAVTYTGALVLCVIVVFVLISLILRVLFGIAMLGMMV